MNKKRFEALDAFRGLCALSVVLFHMRVIDSITELDFFRGSYIFVEFFFVLSGFVLAHGYGLKHKVGFSEFMSRRFFRIYPLHFFMFMVFMILELGKLFSFHFLGLTFNSLPFTGPFAIEEAIPNLLLIQSWTSFTQAESFNYPSWSISIEFYSYAILAFSIIVFRKYRSIFWLLLSLSSFLMLFWDVNILVNQVQRGLSCFFGGCFSYIIFKKIERYRMNYVLASVIELLLIYFILFIVQAEINNKDVIAPFVFIFTVLFFSFEFGVVSNFLKLSILQYLGKISYSIYMTHAAILFCLTSVAMIVGRLINFDLAPVLEGVRFLDLGSVIFNDIFVVVTLFVVIVFSNITYRFVEIPAQRVKLFPVRRNINLIFCFLKAMAFKIRCWVR